VKSDEKNPDNCEIHPDRRLFDIFPFSRLLACDHGFQAFKRVVHHAS
jgi:hypothetical protein